MQMNIYNYQHRIESVLRRIEESQISPENKSTIQEFYLNCQAEDLSIARISKLLYHVMRIALILNKNFTDASKEDIFKVVREIEVNAEWSPATKHDYKVVLK